MKKSFIFTIGIVIVIFGVILLPLPGPGLLTIALGLVILSSEFEWPKRHLHSVNTKFKAIIKDSKQHQQNSNQDDSKKNKNKP